MRRVIFVLGLLAAAVPASAQEDRESALVEMSYFYGNGGKIETLQLWLEAAEKEKELAEDEDLNDKTINRKLKIARAQLRQLTAKLGREVKVRFFCTDRYAWQEIAHSPKKKTYALIRLDADPPWFATWDSKSKNATKMGLKALVNNKINDGITYKFDGLAPKPLSIIGRKSVLYTVGGGIGGKMYVSEADKKALPILQEFADKARDKMGGYRAELIWAVVDGVQHLPVIGAVSLPRGGWRFDGSQGRGEKMSFALRDTRFRKKGDDDWAVPELKIPDGKKVRERFLPKSKK